MTDDDPRVVRQLRVRAAGFYRLAGDPERAAAILEQVLCEVPAGAERAEVLFELAATRLGNAPAQIALYERALGDVEHPTQGVLGLGAW